jgi:hypothetical protein
MLKFLKKHMDWKGVKEITTPIVREKDKYHTEQDKKLGGHCWG